MCASYVQLETQLSSLLGGQEKGWQIFIIEYEHLKQNIA